MFRCYHGCNRCCSSSRARCSRTCRRRALALLATPQPLPATPEPPQLRSEPQPQLRSQLRRRVSRKRCCDAFVCELVRANARAPVLAVTLEIYLERLKKIEQAVADQILTDEQGKRAKAQEAARYFPA